MTQLAKNQIDELIRLLLVLSRAEENAVENPGEPNEKTLRDATDQFELEAGKLLARFRNDKVRC